MNRRKFLYSSAMVAGTSGIVSSFGVGATLKADGAAKNILLGVISVADNPEEDLKVVRDLGFPTCQLSIESYSPELAVRLFEPSVILPLVMVRALTVRLASSTTPAELFTCRLVTPLDSRSSAPVSTNVLPV